MDTEKQAHSALLVFLSEDEKKRKKRKNAEREKKVKNIKKKQKIHNEIEDSDTDSDLESSDEKNNEIAIKNKILIRSQNDKIDFSDTEDLKKDVSMETDSDNENGNNQEEEDEEKEDKIAIDFKKWTGTGHGDNDGHKMDPFYWHFSNINSEKFENLVGFLKKNETGPKWKSSLWDEKTLGRPLIYVPNWSDQLCSSGLDFFTNNNTTNGHKDDNKNGFDDKNQNKVFNKKIEILAKYFIRERFLDTFFKPNSKTGLKRDMTLNINSLGGSSSNSLSSLQVSLAKPIFNYMDLLYAPCKYDINAKYEIRNILCLHTVNHIFKTRQVVLKNNTKLASIGDKDNEKEDNNNKNFNDEIEYRDQGFTRPKVLIILPTRNSCYEFVSTILKIFSGNQTENYKRFLDEFYDKNNEIGKNKPEDFQHLFKGNTDDLFRIGIKFTRKSVKLFSQFYQSDIIIASPLGLRLAIGDGKSTNSSSKKGNDYDYLSSIEILIMDQTDALLEQNWYNIEHIFSHLNLIPRSPPSGCDFSRIRSWYLDENSKYLRQTLIFSQYITPEMNSILNNTLNVGGKVKVRPIYSLSNCAMNKIGFHIKQVFIRFSQLSLSPLETEEKRFKYFSSTMLPSIARSAPKRVTKDINKDNKPANNGVLIIVNDYIEFIRVRNLLESSGLVSYTAISEYSSFKEVTRSRTLFIQGIKHVLLYSLRAHHFRRYDLKGASNIIFYSPPINPIFYSELVRMVGRTLQSVSDNGDDIKCRVLYSKWDVLQLERLVSSERVGQMVTGKNEIFEFY